MILPPCSLLASYGKQGVYSTMYVRSACGNCIVIAELVDDMERGT